MSNEQHCSPGWDGILDIRIDEQIGALANLAEQAGREAYHADTAAAVAILPFPHWQGVTSDDPTRRLRAKVYAGQLLIRYPANFGDAFPLAPICKWWLMGYDKAHGKLQENAR